MREPSARVVRPGQGPGAPVWLTRTLEAGVILAGLATIPLVLVAQPVSGIGVAVVGDWLVWVVFLTEYLVLLALATDRRVYLRSSWLNLAVVVVAFPPLAELLVLAGRAEYARVVVLVRLVLVTWRLLQALQFMIGRRRVVYIAAVTTVLVIAGGGALAVLEPETTSTYGFWDGVWWAVVTVATVGYGDITPKSPEGRLIGVLLMGAGIGLVSTVAASLAAYFVEQDVNAERRALAQRLQRIAGHIVVCGLGRKGTLLARAFIERGYEVVALELDESNPSVAELRDLGAIVLIGDATDTVTLQRAKVTTAAGLIAVCADDDTNADIVIHADELTRGRVGDPLQGLAHIVDPLLCDLFKRMEVGTEHGGGFRLQFFNVHDGAARAVLQAHPAFDPTGSDPVHEILVVGLGQIGQRLVFNLARNWRERYLASGTPLGITMVDRDADRVRETLLTRYPQLLTASSLTAYSIEHRSAAFHQASFLGESSAGTDGPVRGAPAARGSRFGIVYVALEDDAATLSAALELRQRIHDLDVPVVACMNEATGLVRLLEGVDGAANRVPGLRAFRVLEQTCTPALLLDTTTEILARVHHEDFLRHEVALGHTAATNPSIVPWEQLPEDRRESSRQAVDHIPIKLHAVGCDIEPMTDWDAELFEFTPEEIEVLAEMEHERWIAERMRGGYTYGPVRDDVARTHPDLLPWAALSEETKDKDRTFIRGLPVYLAGVGFQIIRRAPARAAAR